MRQTLVGVFDRHAQAEHAARQLRDSGFGDSVFVTDDPGSAGGASSERDTGVLAHMRDFFANLFGSDDREVGPYAEAVRRGGAVVKVEVEDDERMDLARQALEAAGAIDIDAKADEWRASGWDAGTATAGSATGRTATPASAESSDVIPVVREELQVGKRVVGTGGVRVYTRVVEEPVQETLELREEHANVERRAVDRPATTSDLDALGERTIEVREMAEQPVVAKEARVVEEVRVGKTVETRTEQIDERVRRTEVEVENLAAQGTAGATATTGSRFDSEQFRSHWQTNFASQGGSWSDYEPAYRYGSTMRQDTRWSGRAWEDVEPDLRRDWETRHPGSAWERFKAAIRHGWDRMTG